MGRCLQAALLLLLVSITGWAQTPRIELEPVATAGLSQPVLLTHARDGSGRRFIVEQVGRIQVMQPGSTERSAFLDIRSLVLSGGERGLLGLAFHPQFVSNRRFFVNYTRQPDGATVIAEYRASAADGNVADANSRIELLMIRQPFSNHNGGMIEFGPDGFLYIGMGDGGSANDPNGYAQNVNELLGKMLRIDVDQPTSAAVPYSSPSTNPFFGPTPGRDEIFAYGFRNPWRFSFDRLTGQLYAGDVGQNAVEEVDNVLLGGNYGWRVFEGSRCTNLDAALCSARVFIAPIAEYPNQGSNGRCSITGGYVYRGAQQSLPYGAYIFGDYCSGEIIMLRDGAQTTLLDTSLDISSFGEDESGEIYVLSHGGLVYRITNPDARFVSQREFILPDLGSMSVTMASGTPGLAAGYARVQNVAGTTLPEGFEILGLRQNGILVSETSVPAAPLVQSGFFYAEASASVNTGIAIANPNPEAVTIEFYFTGADGEESVRRSTTIPANQQTAAFLNQSPFNGGDAFQGAFTFNASLLVSVVAFRGLTNERSEFLPTPVPVMPLAVLTRPITFAQYADGGGWTTEFFLMNPTGDVLMGRIELEDSQFSYSLPPKASQRFVTPGTDSAMKAGGAVIIASPIGFQRFPQPPAAMAILRFQAAGVTVTQTAVSPMLRGSGFRTYVERSPAIRTGLAIKTRGPGDTTVTLELLTSNGGSTGVVATIVIPANGHTATFLDDVPGFATIPVSFQGVLRITSDSDMAVSAFRVHANERGEFLISALPTIDSTQITASSELLFPHFAIGGGYEMQLVLFNGHAGTSSSGTVYFFTQGGQSFPLIMR